MSASGRDVHRCEVLNGVDFMGWLYESIKKRHREDGISEGELQRDKVLRDWYIAKKNAGTLGTDNENPVRF